MNVKSLSDPLFVEKIKTWNVFLYVQIYFFPNASKEKLWIKFRTAASEDDKDRQPFRCPGVQWVCGGQIQDGRGVQPLPSSHQRSDHNELRLTFPSTEKQQLLFWDIVVSKTLFRSEARLKNLDRVVIIFVAWSFKEVWFKTDLPQGVSYLFGNQWIKVIFHKLLIVYCKKTWFCDTTK